MTRLIYYYVETRLIDLVLAQADCVLTSAMRNLAIVITIVQSFFFFSLRLLLVTHFGESPVCENLFPPIFWHN